MAQPEEFDYITAGDPIYSNDQISRYATQDPAVFIEWFEFPDPLGYDAADSDQPIDFPRYLKLYEELRSELSKVGLGSFVPEVMHSDLEDQWIAFGMNDGLYPLAEVAESFPQGIDGRDWAWILRRILMVLDVGVLTPNLESANVLVHPEDHGVVILGWQPVPDPSVYPLDQILRLMGLFILKSADGKSQIELMERLAAVYRDDRQPRSGPDGKSKGIDREPFSYGDAITDYRVRLERLYGAPRFRELVLEEDSIGFLEEESEFVREATGV